jgi:hypothetical protein
MKPEVEHFCRKIQVSEKLSYDYIAMFRDICSDDIDLDDFITEVRPYYEGPDRILFDQYAQEVQDYYNLANDDALAHSPTTVSANPVSQMKEASPDVQVPLDLDWFCLYLVAENMVPWDACVSLYADLGNEADVLNFAQYLVRTGMCNDLLVVQDLVDRAIAAAEANEPIPVSVFSNAEGEMI